MIRKEQQEKIENLTGKYSPKSEFIEKIRKKAKYSDDFKGGLKASQDATEIQALLKLNVENQNTTPEDINTLLEDIIKGYYRKQETKEERKIKEYPPIEISSENGEQYIRQLGRFGDADPNTKHGFYHLININTTLIKQNEQIKEQNQEIIKLLSEIKEKL